MKPEIKITINHNIDLKGILSIPDDAHSLIIFSHGSGSSRLSPRNNFVAQKLNNAGFATLLVDLLTVEEDELFEKRFDIPLLSQRLFEVTKYIRSLSQTRSLPIGYFGASTGAASALIASTYDAGIKAIVSRGGRPDLAKEFLPEVKCPTLLIVGGDDGEVIDLNRHAYARLRCDKKIEIVPGASHLFEEPGKLEKVTELANDWFQKIMVKSKKYSY